MLNKEGADTIVVAPNCHPIPRYLSLTLSLIILRTGSSIPYRISWWVSFHEYMSLFVFRVVKWSDKLHRSQFRKCIFKTLIQVLRNSIWVFASLFANMLGSRILKNSKRIEFKPMDVIGSFRPLTPPICIHFFFFLLRNKHSRDASNNTTSHFNIPNILFSWSKYLITSTISQLNVNYIYFFQTIHNHN